MTPETREELARAIRTHFANDMTMQPVLNAIAPIIERLVAERVAAETERCARYLDGQAEAGERAAFKAETARLIADAGDKRVTV